MLHIIGMILKILGILLLVIVGLLLLILLTILLVPIRYEAFIEKQEKLLAHGKVSWLFSIIKLEFSYSEDGINTEFKFFRKKKEEPTIKYEYSEEQITALEREIDEDEEEEVIEPEPKSAQEAVEEIQIEDGELIDAYSEDDIKDEEEVKKEKKPSQLKEKLLEIYEFIKKPSVRNTIGKIFNRLKKTTKKILPRKLNANFHFGFGDPALTGGVLAVASMFYALYCGCINLEPDFESEEIVIDGNIDMKGKIRFVYFLSFVIKTAIDIWFDKEIRTFIMKMLRR